MQYDEVTKQFNERKLQEMFAMFENYDVQETRRESRAEGRAEGIVAVAKRLILRNRPN